MTSTSTKGQVVPRARAPPRAPERGGFPISFQVDSLGVQPSQG
jgi:hypothetical protein